MPLYEILQPGLFKSVGPPAFGRQDQGVSPGGAMDRLAYETGRILLGGHPGVRTLEIILPPVLRWVLDCVLVLTGAHFDDSRLVPPGGGGGRPITHGETVAATAGTRIEFGPKGIGFRGYLSMLPLEEVPDGSGLAGRRRGDFDARFSWPDTEGRIRILKGPEHRYLNAPDAFPAARWKTTQEMSDMGMRLAGDGEPLSVSMANMVSAPVSDGTIQLTPKGPIVLLRHRQTVGGYPRIYNVISADVDLLAQYGPEQVVRFREVGMEEAVEAARTRCREIEALAAMYGLSPREAGRDRGAAAGRSAPL